MKITLGEKEFVVKATFEAIDGFERESGTTFLQLFKNLGVLGVSGQALLLHKVTYPADNNVKLEDIKAAIAEGGVKDSLDAVNDVITYIMEGSQKAGEEGEAESKKK